MNSVQKFEVVQTYVTGEIDEETLKHVLTIVKQVVENSSLDRAMDLIKSKLNEKHGGNIDIMFSQHGRWMVYVIGGIKVRGLDAVLAEGRWCQVEKGVDVKNLSTAEKRSLPAYRWGNVSGYVSLTYSLPNLFNGEGPAPLPSCNIQDNHILRLMFLAHVTQLLFSMAHSLPTCTKPDFRHCPPAKDCRPLLDLIEVVTSVKTSSSSEESTVPTIDPMAVWQEVMEQSIGFLRCCALFYHYLSGVSAPSELTSLLPPDQELVHLTKYLAIPNSPKHLLDSPFSLLLAKKWANHPNVHIELELS